MTQTFDPHADSNCSINATEAQEPNSTTIRALNDAFRASLKGGAVMFTAGVADRGAAFQERILQAVRTYDAFDPDNDPYGEHDFGRIELDGEAFLFKIDYYDLALSAHSPDPANPDLTSRVLTIMLAQEW